MTACWSSSRMQQAGGRKYAGYQYKSASGNLTLATLLTEEKRPAGAAEALPARAARHRLAQPEVCVRGAGCNRPSGRPRRPFRS